VALAHALQENATLKEQLLRVQLATSIGNPPVSLLQQCTNILSQVWHRLPASGWSSASPGGTLLLCRRIAARPRCECHQREGSLFHRLF